MDQIRIYFDEDAMDSDLVAALRSPGVEVITLAETGLIGKTDDEQLAFAAERECVLNTFNVCDFYRLSHGMDEGRERASRNASGAATTLRGR